MPRCCVLLAEGFEEIEAVTVIDVLRRADVETMTLSLGDLEVTGSHGIAIRADGRLDDHLDAPWDLVVCPGGMPGSAHLRDDPRVTGMLARQHERGGRVAAICAAPIALAGAGLVEGRRVTSYPSFGDKLPGADYQEDRVVVDDRITTSRGPGTALEFALGLVAQLVGEERSHELAGQMLLRR